ncbi:hypothetical protein [Candidatus Protochlamydia phocaeensis]|uniref:hypothetical protein n=1 Tax=Candidatus Protochlamydia phocaeensis TaxID=1414722 RepID=UPI000838FFDB|nr:hypothetical protein [Candidatus Protochlamydia phocaeensis]
MANIARDWNDSYHIVQEQIEAFNKSVQSSIKLDDLSHYYEPEELDKIYQVVKAQVQHLQTLSEEIEKRKEKVEGGCSTYTRSAVITTTVLNGISKVFVIGGAAVAVFSPEPISKWVGLGCAALGEIFDLATTTYSTKAFFDEDEKSTLATINREGIEQAKVFKKFIKRLKEIREIARSRFQEQSVNININIDGQIGDCLRHYEALGKLSKDEVYFRILSLLIQHLPDEDPLKAQLQSLKPARFSDLTVLAHQPLPVSYLSQENRDQEDKGKGIDKRNEESLSSSEDNKWQGEKASHLKEESVLEEIDPLQSQQEYVKRLAFCKHAVADRFRLGKDIKYLYTRDGWCITSNGLKPAHEVQYESLVDSGESTSSRKKKSKKSADTEIIIDSMV